MKYPVTFHAVSGGDTLVRNAGIAVASVTSRGKWAFAAYISPGEVRSIMAQFKEWAKRKP